MQINELLLKNFGKFHDRQINLEEGINLIHGENESGKSTIHTFIKGMLFGIDGEEAERRRMIHSASMNRGTILIIIPEH